jgi:CRISPR-associated endonuclease Csn1
MSRTLGLDVGPNSIGWALIDEEQNTIIDLGVRIFSEGVDNFDTKKEKSRNETRRTARGMRRQAERRSRRKRILRKALIEAGLWPDNRDQQLQLLKQDPYELRSRAVDPSVKLTPHEIGRVILHLNQRRGFLSNRKRDREDSEVRGMLEEISELEQELNGRTLGQYLHEKHRSLQHTNRKAEDHVRRRHTRRAMLEAEFDAIWANQARFAPDLLTESLRTGRSGEMRSPRRPLPLRKGDTLLAAFGIRGILFFQRPMYWPKSVVGLCELEPKEKRCPRADRRAQRFRMLQEVNNLRFIDPDEYVEKRLSPEHRTLVLSKLARTEKATFDQIRKWLGFLESVKFNLEKGHRSSLRGVVTDCQMAKVCGKAWHNRPDAEKTAIVELLLDNQSDNDAVVERLVTDFGFSMEQADLAMAVDFQTGYVNLSRKALDRLLPHLERGLNYMDDDETNSALHAAGYLRRDQLRRRLFDTLPDPLRVKDAPIGEIPNPVVRRALVELRKVVNALFREYGRPDAVHVELARSVRMGPKARDDYNRRIREQEAKREDAVAEIRQRQGVRVTRDNILRYLLWQEQSHECLYCSRPITQQQLFGGDIDIDHILPYSRCLDDSQANKVVCHRSCNHDKGNQSPYERWADRDPATYERICQQAGSLMRRGLVPYAKYRRFLQKELDLDHFIARQLVDTSYIARATVEYIRCLFEDDHAVLGLKGQYTATLRWLWGLNSVLGSPDDNYKSRDDHRHHAVDAAVIALTNRRRLQQLSHLSNGTSFTAPSKDRPLPAPWESFRTDLSKRINGIYVSHRVERKISGALHEDTHYGPTEQPHFFVVRKPVESLSANEIPLIRDNIIRAIIEQRLAENGIEMGRGKNINAATMKRLLANTENPLTMPSGVPIKKVRVLRKEQTIQPIRNSSGTPVYVKPGSNHHVCLFNVQRNGKTLIEATYTTRLEAHRRLKQREAIVQRTHPLYPDASFLMSLCVGDSVLVRIDEEDVLMVVSTLVSTQKRIHLVDARDARRSAKKKDIGLSPSSLIQKYHARKVTVDPLGWLRWAND